VAFFNSSETVTREEWRIFTQHQKVEKTLPGIQGIGFSLLIPRAELTAHIQKIRREGFPQYKLRPDGDRDVYSSIIYLEPFSGRNLRAFGYDMFSEPVRRSAMERARDTDAAALSGKVVLVQETDKAVQAGTLMYAPVYRKGMPIETVEQRRAAIYGWVSSPYRMNDLMQGIFGNRNLAREKQLHLQVFDGTQPSIQSLLYDSQPTGDEKLRPDARFTRQIPVDFNGQRWTLRFTQTGGGFTTVDYISVWLTLVSGIIISLLLFSLIRTLLNTRAEAQRISMDITEQLRESEEKYRIIFNNEIYAICIFDLETLTLLDTNDAYARVYGYTREELISGMTIHDITAEHQVSDESTKQAIREGTIFIPLRYHRKKDGTVFPVEIVGGPYIWKGRKVMFALAHDITNRKQAETEKDALELQNRQLQKTESLSRMAAAIAHHFNNQLGVVIGNLEMAIDDQPKGAPPSKSLTAAMKAAWNSADMSGLMLTYLGQTHDKRESLDLSYSCRKILPIIETTLPGNVVLETDFPTPRPIIMANVGEIQQILTNLLTNAREAIGNHKGTISLSVKTVSPIDISTKNRFPVDWESLDKTLACLELKDT
jgi:PAS domain S-box-containing protein